MPTNSHMLELMFKKVSGNPEYFAWYFTSYMGYENKKLSELLEQLKIDETGFYYLSLCKAPNNNVEFSIKMKKVADFAGINVFPLLEIVRFVDSIKHFNANSHSINSIMMAARLKDSSNSNSTDE